MPEAPREAVGSPKVGTIVGWSRVTRQLVVDYPGNVNGPVRSLSTMQVSEAEADELAKVNQRVLLSFDRANPAQPIVTGILREELLQEEYRR
ncbi:MAG: hypothetical protein JWN04_71 [Myxococcaceae bacterium]|nr:hypothetical protein [Myxococcaceae bacterium]